MSQSKKMRPYKNKRARKVTFNRDYINNTSNNQIDFKKLAAEALFYGREIYTKFLPQGRIEGHEYVALNPKRNDTRMGSFKINLNTGCWADFATGDKGGDLISLVAYVTDQTQLAAALEIKQIIGG